MYFNMMHYRVCYRGVRSGHLGQNERVNPTECQCSNILFSFLKIPKIKNKGNYATINLVVN